MGSTYSTSYLMSCSNTQFHIICTCFIAAIDHYTKYVTRFATYLFEQKHFGLSIFSDIDNCSVHCIALHCSSTLMLFSHTTFLICYSKQQYITFHNICSNVTHCCVLHSSHVLLYVQTFNIYTCVHPTLLHVHRVLSTLLCRILIMHYCCMLRYSFQHFATMPLYQWQKQTCICISQQHAAPYHAMQCNASPVLFCNSRYHQQQFGLQITLNILYICATNITAV